MSANRTRPIGEIRPSQLIHTFGVGATVELPGITGLLTGLDEWPKDQTRLITENRLREAVRREAGFENVEELRTPPVGEDDDPAARVPVLPFPRWLRCPRCRMLAPIESGVFALETNAFRPERNRFTHDCPSTDRDGKRRTGKGAVATVLPARYMLSCERGHLDDFPWDFFVHQGGACPDGGGTLELREQALATSAADITVRCLGCDQSRPMSVAFGERAIENLPGGCRGRHPHIDRVDFCDELPQTLVLGASNAWFAHSLSVLEIPQEEDVLAAAVEAHWAALEDVETEAVLGIVLRVGTGLGEVADLVSEKGAAAVVAAITARRSGEDGPAEEVLDLKVPEWEAFAAPDSVKTTEDFELRRVDVPRDYAAVIADVVQVHKLREVVALTGFSRLDAGGPRAPISRQPPNWVPCAETRGEGVFLRFHEEAIRSWERQYDAVGRSGRLEQAHRDWRERRNMDLSGGWPGSRFVVLHSLAHALLREMALESGYGAASIRERIYATGQDGPDMAGVLLYTAAPDSEGTLGGLVSLGDPEQLGPLLDHALERARLCSSDPICSEHHAGHEDGTVHDAACHACQFIAETSCESGNRFLDRSALVPTFATDSTRIALFER